MSQPVKNSKSNSANTPIHKNEKSHSKDDTKWYGEPHLLSLATYRLGVHEAGMGGWRGRWMGGEERPCDKWVRKRTAQGHVGGRSSTGRGLGSHHEGPPVRLVSAHPAQRAAVF